MDDIPAIHLRVDVQYIPALRLPFIKTLTSGRRYTYGKHQAQKGGGEQSQSILFYNIKIECQYSTVPNFGVFGKIIVHSICSWVTTHDMFRSFKKKCFRSFLQGKGKPCSIALSVQEDMQNFSCKQLVQKESLLALMPIRRTSKLHEKIFWNGAISAHFFMRIFATSTISIFLLSISSLRILE